ncbi:unnamed protein product [Amoebophrya sp. A120]|nr:unnamed protein product [Amoebophrya sp. A120]|eukprot:GSA120T00016005001.1
MAPNNKKNHGGQHPPGTTTGGHNSPGTTTRFKESDTNKHLNHIRASTAHNEKLDQLIQHAQEADEHGGVCREIFYAHIRDSLKGCIFVGHINTDLDSVAGAIGAAALFDGIPAISENKLNGEILFALEECKIQTPELFENIPNAKTTAKVCLVDHSEEKQMTPFLKKDKNRGSRIVGIIDHHALAESFSTSKPLFMDLRPWGSMSTIVTVLFLSHKKFLPPKIAKLLLMAVLSDTLNLQSITTTEPDRQVVALLSSYGKVPDPDKLARQQFQKKTDFIVNLGAYEMIRGDQKDFSMNNWKVGISVLEVTDVEPVLKVAPEIMLELRMLKKEKGEVVETAEDGSEISRTRDYKRELDFAYLFVVDILNEKSYLIIAGGRELVLAKKAFPDAPSLGAAVKGIPPPGKTINEEETLMTMKHKMVSRKAQFAPAILEALADPDYSWCHKRPVALMSALESANEKAKDYSEKLYSECQEHTVINSTKVVRVSRMFSRELEAVGHTSHPNSPSGTPKSQPRDGKNPAKQPRSMLPSVKSGEFFREPTESGQSSGSRDSTPSPEVRKDGAGEDKRTFSPNGRNRCCV